MFVFGLRPSTIDSMSEGSLSQVWEMPAIAPTAQNRRRTDGAQLRCRQFSRAGVAPQRGNCLAGHVGLEPTQIIPLKGRANSRESSRIPATETVRVLSCGCNSGLNIREDSRTIAFDISTAAAAPGPAGLCGRAKQAVRFDEHHQRGEAYLSFGLKLLRGADLWQMDTLL